MICPLLNSSVADPCNSSLEDSLRLRAKMSPVKATKSKVKYLQREQKLYSTHLLQIEKCPSLPAQPLLKVTLYLSHIALWLHSLYIQRHTGYNLSESNR